MAFFKRSKNRKLVFIFVLLLIIGVGGYFLFNNLKKASAEWFDQNWYYRQAVNISNAGTAQTDYQVSLTLDTATLITAGKMQSSCNDLRITDANGKLLPHWIEGASGGTLGCNTDTTKIWTKVPSLPTSGQTVYVYYGNPNAVNIENGNNVFLFFDDFESGSLRNWNINQAGAGAVNIDATTALETKSAKIDMGTAVPGKLASIGSKVTFSTPFIVEQTARRDSSPLGMNIGMEIANGSSSIYSAIGQFGNHSAFPTQNKRFTSGSATGTYVGSDDTWYKYVSTIQSTTQSTNIYSNYGASLLDTVNTSTTLSQTTGLVLCWDPYSCYVADTYSQNRGILNVDNVFVRKYAATPPTIGSTGSEEKSPAPVAYWKFDEGQGLSAGDSTSNNNTGTLGGSTKPTWQAADQCISGKCLYFNGSSAFVNLGTNTVINPHLGSLTVEGWVKAQDYTYPKTRFPIGGWTSSGSGVPMWAVDASYDSSGIMATFSDGTHRVSGTIACDSGFKPADTLNKWTHIAISFDRTAGKAFAYINGVKQSGQLDISSVTGDVNNTSAYTYISAVAGWYLQGFIDDVKIYPYARTAVQINTDYASRGSASGASVSVGSSTPYLSNGLVGYWKMDEASWNGTSGEVIDSSGNGNNGTATGISTKPTTGVGKYGSGGIFDGTDDYAQIPWSSSFGFGTGNFSIGAWIKLNSISSLALITNIRDSNAATGKPTILFGVRNTSMTLEAQIRDTVGNTTTINSNTPLSDATWYHVALVRTGQTTFSFYVNGVDDGDRTIAGLGNLTPITTQPVQIGVHYYSGAPQNSYFKGTLDEVRIYNRALSSKEESDLYSWAPGPVGWWKMDDKVSGNSQTLIDSSTYGNNATTYYGGNATGMNCKVIGKYGGGCFFDGVDDYVDAGSIRTLDTQGTVGGWVNFSSVASKQSIWNWGSTNGSTSFVWAIRLASSTDGVPSVGNDYLELRVIDSAGIDYTLVAAGTLISAGQWYHFAVTGDGSAHNFYINGVKQTLTAVGGSNTGKWIGSLTLPAGTTKVTIGSQLYQNAYANYSNASIDDVKVYNYARTQKQVLEDLNAGHPSVGSPVGSYAAWWKFDEGHDNTIYDQSVNANTGTNHGASWTNDGKFGKALSFDGSASYIDVADNNSIDIGQGNSASISVWYYSTASDTGVKTLLAKRSADSSDSTDYMLFTQNGNLTWGTGTATDTCAWQSIAEPSRNAWHHVVGIISASAAQAGIKSIYIDGTLAATCTYAVKIAATSTSLFIGKYYGAGGYWKGKIDEVKIYPFALTADDIKTEYNNRASISMGSLSDTSGLAGGSIASNSASALYCIPGDTATCNPPVGEWKMDEHTGITAYDSSGNSNNGNLGGGTAAYRPTWQSSSMCHSGSCLKFDGIDDYLDAGNKSQWNLASTSHTIELWFKMPANADYKRLIDRFTGGVPGNGYVIYTYNTGIYIEERGDNGSIALSKTALNDNAWHHLSYVVDTSIKRGYLYLDGAYSSYATYLGNLLDYNATLTIGGDAGSNYLNGLIDNVQIYNYARTPAQVAWDYNRGKPVGWWKFDECQGTTTVDSSGNGNTGTITIGASGSQTTAGTCTTPSDGTGAWYNGKTGRFNSAMSFDGSNDYVEVADSSLLDPASYVSVSSWVYKTGYIDQTYDERVVSKRSTGETVNYVLQKYGGAASNKNYMSFAVAVAGTYKIATDIIDIPLNQWVFYTGTYDGSFVRLYRNGSLISSTAASGVITTSTRVLRIGAEPDGTASRFWDGLIDDVKIHNYALTPAQIKLDYNQSSAVRFGPTSGRP